MSALAAAVADEVFDRDGGKCTRCGIDVNRQNRKTARGAAFVRVSAGTDAEDYWLVCLKCKHGIRDSRGAIGYYRLDDKLPELALDGWKRRDVEDGLRQLGIDEDSVLLDMRRRGVHDDLGTDGPVDDDVPAVRPDTHDPALVDAPADEVSSGFKGRRLDTDDQLQGRAPGPESLHGQSLPDASSDTPEAGGAA